MGRSFLALLAVCLLLWTSLAQGGHVCCGSEELGAAAADAVSTDEGGDSQAQPDSVCECCFCRTSLGEGSTPILFSPPAVSVCSAASHTKPPSLSAPGVFRPPLA